MNSVLVCDEIFVVCDFASCKLPDSNLICCFRACMIRITLLTGLHCICHS